MIPVRVSKTGRCLVALFGGLVSLCIVFLRLGLWHYDLSVPIVYWGDALYETVLVKALTEGAWNYHIPRLGAPFGMDAVDFPIGCTLDFLFMKILSLVVRNPCLLINLYWLLTIGLAGAFATLLFKYLRISSVWAATFGILYAIIPFVFYRNVSHLNLVHFTVPGAAYLALSLAHGESLSSLQYDRRSPERNLRIRNLIVALIVCLAIGLAYIYWAFFACILIAIACLIGLSRTKKPIVLLIGLLYVVVIGLAATADISASLIYWHHHGSNAALNYKAPTEADIYGLKIRQMVTPIREHPVRVFRRIREKLTAAGFPFDANESGSAALGIIGSVGLAILIGVAITGGTQSDSRLGIFSGFTIGLLLIAGVGGFGSLFNVFVMHEFRAYNRVSPFISLFSLGALAILLDSSLSKIQPYWRYVGAAVILFIGAFDQVPVAFFKYHTAEEQCFKQDRQFMNQLERRVSRGMMIFQLPNTSFPPDGMHGRMRPYDNARAYLHSNTLHWSWGAMDGRHGDWAKRAAALPLSQFLEQLAFAGFEGLMIDRFGYVDNSFERETARLIGEPNKFDLGTRWVFFDLRNFTHRLLGSLPEPELAKRREMIMYPVTAEWRGNFSVEESEKDHSWHWCGKDGVIRLVNDSSLERVVEIEAAFQQFSTGTYALRINRERASAQLTLASEPVPYHEQLLLKPHSVRDIEFHFLGPLLNVPTDSRALAFQVRDFRLSEPDAHNETAIQSISSTAPDTSYQLGTIIRFNDSGSSERFRGSGWSYAEADHTWTEGNSAVLNFSGLPPSQPLTLKTALVGLTKDPELHAQMAAVYANGKKVADWQVTDRKEYTASIPADTVGDTGTLEIEFRIPRAASPKSLGVNTDARVLGLCVFNLVIEKQP